MKYTFIGSGGDVFVRPSDEYSPKRGYGFIKHSDAEPYEFSVYVGSNGEYDITVTIDGSLANGEVSLTAQSRRFMLNGEKIPSDGLHEYSFSVSVCDIHKYGAERCVWDRISLSLMADRWCVASVEITKRTMPVIYIAGDSTVTDQPAEYPYDAKSTFCGWGQMVGGMLKPGIAVSNHAQSGSTTEEFKSCNWNVIKDRIKAGDVLIVEFGHNDQKIAALDAYGGYRDNLVYYIEQARKRGAYPVINSPINRIIFKPDGTLADLLGSYAAACRDTAAEYGVPFVDMLKRTTEYFEAAGAVAAWDYFRCKGAERDYTHTNDIGGALIAKMFLQEVVKNNIEPIARFVKTDMINTPLPEHTEKPADSSSAAVLKHIAGIGLVNIPKSGAIPDIDNDIRNI